MNMRTRWKTLQELFADEDAFRKAVWCAPFFYYVLEFMTFQQLMRFDQLGREMSAPLWPIFWVTYLGEYAVFMPHIFLILLTLATTLGAVFYQHRLARILVFFGILQYQAFTVSVFGQEHDFYIPLYVSLFFIFLPDVWGSGGYPEELRRRFTSIFWGAQAYILLTYTMSGFYKIVGAVVQYRAGEAHYFSPDAAALYVAYWQTQYERVTLLGPFIVEHQILSSFALIGLLYLLLFSVSVAVRPTLHRIWGIGLTLFHISTVVSMGIIFIYNVLFIAVFFLASPFAPEKNNWREVLRDLPILGFIARAIL